MLLELLNIQAFLHLGQSVNLLIDNLPEIAKIILFGGTFNLDTLLGYYGILFSYIVIITASHAVLLGATIISKEENEKTSEFLFVKPISRTKIITSKLFVSILFILILNIITFSSSVLFCSQYENINKEITIFMIGMFFIQLIFLSIGMLISAIMKNSKSAKATNISTAVLLTLYVTSKFIDMSDKLNFLKYLNPFKYFDVQGLINNRIDYIFIILSIMIILISISLTYILYNKKDLNV